jgi:glycosyltransferase involved in cell wall biosynthesis
VSTQTVFIQSTGVRQTQISSSKMHIGIDATALFGRFNGVEIALWNLLVALNNLDGENNYTVYLPLDGPHEDLKNFGKNWRWIRLPFRGGERLKRIVWQQTQLASQAQNDGCELLHSPTYVAPLRAKIPVVLTVYDLIALKQPQLAKRSNVWHYRALLPRSMRKAARVIVPGEQVARDVAQLDIRLAARTRVVPLGVEERFFQTLNQCDEVRARFQLPPKFLLFVGNFEPKKNLATLMRALSLLPDAPPLVLAGGARAWGDMSTHNTSTHVVRSLGYVPREDLPALYWLCEAFVFPSLAEGFGLPVLEALACGAPVVASFEVGVPNLEKVALLCEARDEKTLAQHIARVLHDGDLRAQMKSAGPVFAAPFLWRANAEQTLKIYREVRDEKRA